MTPSPFKHTTALGPLLAGAVLTALLAGCSSSTPPAVIDETSTSSSSSFSYPDIQGTPVTGSDSSPQAAVPSSSEYADGTYSASGNYKSPEGQEQVQVSLTLKDGVITGATYTGEATHPRSMSFQGKFGEGFKEVVVGKSIDALSLTVVNGSSLTPVGFMDAVAKIKAEAKA